MQPRIDISPSPLQTALSTEGGPGDSGVQPSVGQFRGDDVVHQPDVASEIADAAEEITFAASEKVESNLSDRKVKSKSLTKTHAVETAEMYMQMMHDLGPADKLRQFAADLRALQNPTKEQVLQHAQRHFSDLSHQHCALSFAKDVLEHEGAEPELLVALTEARAQLEEHHGPEIRAGLNITRQAMAHAEEGLGDVQELRDFYRDSILGYENISEAYSSILRQHGPERFEQSLDFLIRSAGNDLQSEGPSVPASRLKIVVDDLYQVQVLGNIHRSMGGLLQKVSKEYGSKSDPAAVQEMMKGILALTQNRYCRGDQVTDMTRPLGLPQAEGRIYFLTGLREQLRLLPLKVYPAPENREKLMEASQEALDKAITDEEAGL